MTLQQFLDRLTPHINHEDECHEWTGHAMNGTRPTIYLAELGKRVLVRRHILILSGKDFGQSKVAGNSCGNPLCVNPEHAVVKTKSRVLREAAAATGHARRADRNARIAAGKRRNSRLTLQDIEDIRASSEPSRMLGERYGLSESHINRIRAHTLWRDYRNPFAQLIR